MMLCDVQENDRDLLSLTLLLYAGLWCTCNREELAARLHGFLAEEQDELDQQQRQRERDRAAHMPPRVMLRQGIGQAQYLMRPRLADMERQVRMEMFGRQGLGHGRRDQDQEQEQEVDEDVGEMRGTRRRVMHTMDSDFEDEDDEDENENGDEDDGDIRERIGGMGGPMSRVRVVNYPGRVIIASSLGDPPRDNAPRRGMGQSGTSAMGSAQNNSVVYRSNSSNSSNSVSSGLVGTLLTEASHSHSRPSGGDHSNSTGSTGFRFSALSHPSPGSSSSHVSSQRLISSGQSSLGGTGGTGGMDDIDESTDWIGASASASASARARALFLSSSTSAGIMGEGQASQQASASYPAPNTTFVIRSSGNGSSTTVVPVTSAAVIQSSPT